LISSSSPVDVIPKAKPDNMAITTHSGCMAIFSGSQRAR
jgi:hypothetical protein